MSPFYSKTPAPKGFSGFSLLELMVVLGVMGLLLAMSVPALLTTRSVSLDAAVRDAGAFFEVARSRAVTLGRPVRILIHDEADNSGDYRRKMIRVESSGDGNWRSEGRPLLLPGDVVFDTSRADVTNLRMEYASGQKASQYWLYYEIGADGSVGKTGRNFVLASGEVIGAFVTIPDSNAVRGFRISRNGRLLYFQKAGDIEEVLK